MLWYKAWMETRSRFLISLLGIVALCSFSVYHGDKEALSYTGPAYFYQVLHGAHFALCSMWVLAVTLLTMGGLLREKAVGTASFTLSLPVSRARLMSVRICVGVIQALLLAIVPWSAMFVIASVAGKTHSLSQAGFHLVLLLGGGFLFFAMALLVSSLVEGEYTAPVVSCGVTFAMTVLLVDGSLRSYNPFAFINGVEYFDRHTGLLTGPIPWAHATISWVVAALLVWASVKVMQRREF